MTNVSDTKANTVHDRTKRSCLNCGKYFIPKGDLPAYVEGKTTQVWCNKVCYVALYPPVIKETQCLYCPTVFTPRNKCQFLCGSKECKNKNKEKNADSWRKKYQEDPEYKKSLNEQRVKRYQEDPEYRERFRKQANERRERYKEDPEYRKNHREQDKEYKRKKYQENPEYRKKVNEQQRKWWEKPENKEKVNEQRRERRREDPEFREKVNEQRRRKRRLKNKE